MVEMCLVKRGRERENWLDLAIFSPGPPNHNLSKIERKQKRKLVWMSKDYLVLGASLIIPLFLYQFFTRYFFSMYLLPFFSLIFCSFLRFFVFFFFFNLDAFFFLISFLPFIVTSFFFFFYPFTVFFFLGTYP